LVADAAIPDWAAGIALKTADVSGTTTTPNPESGDRQGGCERDEVAFRGEVVLREHEAERRKQAAYRHGRSRACAGDPSAGEE
jgi:hypothetical protein